MNTVSAVPVSIAWKQGISARHRVLSVLKSNLDDLTTTIGSSPELEDGNEIDEDDIASSVKRLCLGDDSDTSDLENEIESCFGSQSEHPDDKRRLQQLQQLFQLHSTPEEEQLQQKQFILKLLPEDWVICTVAATDDGNLLIRFNRCVSKYCHI